LSAIKKPNYYLMLFALLILLEETGGW